MYLRAGVATTFSPRFAAVLAEAARISHFFGVELHLIHAAEANEEKVGRFREALRSLGLPESSPIHFPEGPPTEAILQAQTAAKIDLMIAGALESATVHRNFTGDVARALLSRAGCDLFLFVDPQETARPLRQIYVLLPDFSDFERTVFHRAMDFAEKIKAQNLTLIHVQTTFAEAKEKVLGAGKSFDESLADLAAERSGSTVAVDTHSVRGNTGFTACEYIQSNEADLLVMPSQFGRAETPVFAPVLDWIIQVIPTNVWVIRDRNQLSSGAMS